MSKKKSYSGYPWIMDRLKRENPNKDDNWIKKEYLKIAKSSSLPSLIEKLGKEEGVKRYIEINKNKGEGHTLNGFIKKYGKEKGTELYNELINKRKNTLSNLISRYGLEEGTRRYNEILRSLNRSLPSYIDKYGEVEGLRRYDERCSKISKSSSLNGFIERYGKELGIKLYNDHAEKSKNTLETFTSRYGEKDGYKRWKEYLEKLSNRAQNSYSKISLDIFNEIKSILISLGYDESDMYYGPNEIGFTINNIENNKLFTVKPDFYLKSKKLVIEFYGDYWHKNAQNLSEEDDGEDYSDLWDWDKIRIKSMYYSEYVDSVMIVWESEYRLDKDGTINKLIKFLTDYGQD